MPIQVKCGGCGNEITVTDAMEGKRGRCPQCDAVVKIPRKGGRRKSRSANRDAPRHTPSYAALMGFAKFLSILAFAGLLGLTFIGVYTGITAMVHGPEGFYGPVHLFQEYAEEHVDHPTLVGIGFIVGGLILGSILFVFVSAAAQILRLFVSVETCLLDISEHLARRD